MAKLTWILVMLTVSSSLLSVPGPVGQQASHDASVMVGSRNRVPLVLAHFGGLELPAAVRRDVGGELARIFAGVSVELSWADGDSMSPPRGKTLLRVIFLPRVPVAWELPPNVLGARLGRAFPPTVVYVFHRNVLHALALDVATLSHAVAVDVTRALARVVAHEVVHAFAPAHGHRGVGLMAAGLNREVLVRRPPWLDPACLAAFFHGLRAAHSKTGVE